MRQLDLFGQHAPSPALVPPSPAPEEPVPFVLPDVLPGQIGLFEPRALLVGRARSAVARGALDEACRDLETVRKRSPDDLAIARELVETSALRDRIARIEGPRTRQRAGAFLSLAREIGGAPEPRASLRRHILARVAAEIRRQHGDAGELEGRLAGEYLLDAGQIEDAQASLVAAVAVRRAARPLFLLADTTFLLGDVATARRLYLQALLLDPFDPALRTARDEAVRALPGAARYEIEIEDEPDAWSAPVGIVVGVLARPAPDEVQAMSPLAEGLSPPRREALTRARGFVEVLATLGATRPGTEATIELRRTMKRLSPRLFAAYMDRVVRSRSG
jgi:hypothetical protein